MLKSVLRHLPRWQSMALLGAALLASACGGGASPPGVTPSPPAATSAPAVSPVASPAASVALPPWPGSLDGAADALLSFVNAGTAQRSSVTPLLESWEKTTRPANAPAELPHNLVLEADTDGDGQPELVVGLIDGGVASGVAGPAGRVFVIHGSGAGHRLVAVPDGVASSGRAGPYLRQAADVNRDGPAEILYTSTECGASTCIERVMVATWAGGSYRLATPESLSMPSGTATFADRDGDGRLELVLEGGLVGSVGAGPQRGRTEVYRLVGGRFELADTVYAPSTLRYFVIIDANAAFGRKDWRMALTLYERAATDATLSDERPGPGADPGPGLRAFARFRMLLSHVLRGSDDAARGVLEEMQRQDAATPYAGAAQVFWHTYGQTGIAEAGCQFVTESAQRQPTMLEPLNGWGYANPDFKPADICVVP